VFIEPLTLVCVATHAVTSNDTALAFYKPEDFASVAQVITRVDELLRREARLYELRFGCEACVHFDATGERCANGYPTDAHRGVDLEQALELLFCKEFELA
jgi:hypothetical protein